MGIFDKLFGKKDEKNNPVDNPVDKIGRAEEKYFESVTEIKDSDEALNILFNEAILATPETTSDHINKALQSSWGYPGVVEGSLSEVKKTVLKNLKILEKRERFDYFRVDVMKEQNCAQIDAFYGLNSNSRYFEGIRIWKTKEKFYAWGSAKLQ